MEETIKLLDVVALTVDLPEYNLWRGQKAFINEWSKVGPAHHCAIGVGHVADQIEKLGALLNLEVRRVC